MSIWHILAVSAVLAAALTLLYLYLIMPALKKKKELPRIKRFYYAHRGLHGLRRAAVPAAVKLTARNENAPENSMAAFRAAVSAGYGIDHRKNGQWDSRQHVGHHLSFGQGSCVCCSGNGFGHVCPCVHTKELGYAPFLWQPHHRTGDRRAGQSSGRKRTYGRAGKHHKAAGIVFCVGRG